ncbi:hypothetical protein I656_00635 [Geobacillus sp. WSUCF1]|nr:hypothetical protein I656_00635 [Geobacillus sp. WSUCF1]
MAIEQLTMPQLGESVTEGTISKWLVSPGDKVNKYDPIAEVITDKVSAEIPSSFAGVIRELIAKEGETLPVARRFARSKSKALHRLRKRSRRMKRRKQKTTRNQPLRNRPAGQTTAAIRRPCSALPKNMALTLNK